MITPFFVYKRSWQTHQVERDLSHPDWGEENPNRNGLS